MPVLKNQQAKAQTQAPAKSTAGPAAGKRIDPFAAKYAETEAVTGSGFVPLPVGDYEGLIIEAQGVREDDPSKKEYAYFEIVVVNCENETLNGKKIRIFFNFTKEDGSEGEGMPYFKAANEMLGGSAPTGWDDMCDTLAEIAKEVMWVRFKAVQRKKYTNYFLESVFEEQSEKPELPE